MPQEINEVFGTGSAVLRYSSNYVNWITLTSTKIQQRWPARIAPEAYDGYADGER